MPKKLHYTFIPYEFPKSRDGRFICMLDDGQILRSRREQLGLSVQQVADMAGLKFSQYQRLESGERFFTGCSMKTGLAVCAVLLLDPYDLFDVEVQQPDPATMMPHEPFDFDLPDELFRHRRVGRKPIRRDIMTVYLNHRLFSMIIPRNVLESLGKPVYIQLRWNKDEKRLLLHGVDSTAESAIDVPPHLSDSCSALALPPLQIIDQVKKDLYWDDDAYAVECRLVRDSEGHQYILCDLYKAQPSECIDGPFAIPARFDDENEFEEE